MKLSLANLNLIRVAVLASLALALLASCGGGDQIEKFVPNRIIVFGDEASLIEAPVAPSTDGNKYTVNGVERASDGTLAVPTARDCTRNPVWVQVLANDYGYQFAECLTTATSANAFMRAVANGTVATTSAAINSYMTSPGFNDKDLVTIMVGTHDVVAASTAGSPSAALLAAEAAGRAVGDLVIRVTERGARVIVATIPDVGSTPDYVGTANEEFLSSLTSRFNTALRVRLQDVRGGGHSAGLVLGDELVLLMRRSPGGYGLVNVVDEACAVALPNCDESNVVATGASYGTDWLWAGPLQLGPNAQGRLGSAAVYRARNNPF